MDYSAFYELGPPPLPPQPPINSSDEAKEFVPTRIYFQSVPHPKYTINPPLPFEFKSIQTSLL